MAGVVRPRPGVITNKDIRRLVDVAVAAGWEFSMTGGGHGRLRSPDGVSTVVFPGTTRRTRSVLNMRGALRRAGVEVP